MSIGKKFILWVTFFVSVVGLVAAYVFYRSETAEEARRLESLGSTVGQLLEESLDNFMLTRDKGSLDITLSNLGKVSPISRIRLVNNENIIKASTESSDMEKKLPEVEIRDRNGRAISRDGGRIFRWIQPISNKPACNGCHNPAAKFNGIFVVDFSLREIDSYLRKDIAKGFIILFPSIVVIALVIFLLSRNLVMKRLEDVTSHIRTFEEGNYVVRIPLTRDDEMTRLEKGFNDMADAINARDKEKTELFDRINAANEKLTLEISERMRAEEEIRRNYDVQSAINALLRISLEEIPIDEVLGRTLDLILSLPWLSIESSGSIFLAEDDQETLVMKAQRGLPSYLQSECAKVPFGRCLCGRAALTREVQFASGLDDRHDISYDSISPHGHYCVPIMISDKVLGVINTYLVHGHQRVPQEEEFLNAVANALAGIIRRNKVEMEKEKLISDLRIMFDKVSRSQKLWAETFDSIGDLISIHDEDFNVIKANKAFADYYGVTPQEIVNRKCYEFFHAGDSATKNCPHRITLSSNRPASSEIVDPQNKKIFRISTFPFSYPETQFRGSIHIAKDITEEKEAEMRLIMSERLAALGQMASGIAHEINNPLASIAGCTEGLLRRVEKDRYDPDLFKNYLTIISEEILRCKNITTGMLSFVRKASPERRMIDLNETIEKTIEIISFQGRLKNVAVVKNLSTEMSQVTGNEGELRQVFLIVVTNALDAMDDRGVLTIETGLSNSSAFVKIIDTGAGIDSDHADRIFDPFFTTKSEAGGTGLGLSIARKIISGHGGGITVSSEKDKGSTFIISLPAGV